MPRNFGRIFASQWDDDDFLSLGADAKYVYDFLIPQHDLGHSGIVTLRIAPWARRLSKTTVEVEAALRELHQRWYVVIDDDEMLLLVRALIRRDDVYKQPNVFKSAAGQIYACPSHPIRVALLAELERLPEDEMKGDTRQVCADLIAWLRKTSGDPSPNPFGKGSGSGREGESQQVARFGRRGGDIAGEEGYGNPSGEGSPRACARARVPSPLPPPLSPPEPHSAPAASGDAGRRIVDGAPPQQEALPGAPAAGGKPQTAKRRTGGKRPAAGNRGTRIPEDFAVTAAMVAWARENAPAVDGRLATAEFIDYWRAVPGAKGEKLDWAATWRNRMRELEKRAEERGPKVSGTVLPFQQRPAANDLGTAAHLERAYARAQAREAESAIQQQAAGQ